MNQHSRFSGGCYITLVLEVLILMPDKTGKYLKYVWSVQYHWPKKISGVHLPPVAGLCSLAKNGKRASSLGRWITMESIIVCINQHVDIRPVKIYISNLFIRQKIKIFVCNIQTKSLYVVRHLGMEILLHMRILNMWNGYSSHNNNFRT
jgi:hypothetical protein